MGKYHFIKNYGTAAHKPDLSGGGSAAVVPDLYATSGDVQTTSSSVYQDVKSFTLDAGTYYLIEIVGGYTGAFGTIGPDLAWDLPTNGTLMSVNMGTDNNAQGMTQTFNQDTGAENASMREDNADNSALSCTAIIYGGDGGTATFKMKSGSSGQNMKILAGTQFIVRTITNISDPGELTSTGTADWKELASMTLEANKTYVVKAAFHFTSTATAGSVPQFRLQGLPTGATAAINGMRTTSGSNNEERFAVDENAFFEITSASAGERGGVITAIIIVGDTGGDVTLEFASLGATNCVMEDGSQVVWYEPNGTATRLGSPATHATAATWGTAFTFTLSASKSYYAEVVGGWEKTSSNVTGNIRVHDAPSTQYANVYEAQTNSAHHHYRTDNTITPNKFLSQSYAAIAGMRAVFDGGAGGDALFQFSPTTDVSIQIEEGSVAVLEECNDQR